MINFEKLSTVSKYENYALLSSRHRQEIYHHIYYTAASEHFFFNDKCEASSGILRWTTYLIAWRALQLCPVPSFR